MTTVHYIEKYLKDGDKILDIGAGAGEYSLYFARKGYEVSALELADANIAAFKKKLTPEDKIDLVQGNALDLSRYADKSFDIVLLFGPLYHCRRGGEHPLLRRHAGGEPGSDEHAAHPGSGRRQDLLRFYFQRFCFPYRVRIRCELFQQR